MARWRKLLPFRELTIPLKMAAAAVVNRGRAITPFRELDLPHGSLRLVDGVPLVRVRGTPLEMGRALGTLVGVQAAEVFQHYMGFFAPDRDGDLALARQMQPQLPQWFTDEMTGFSQTSELTADDLLLGQTFLDIHKVALCSTLAAHGSATVDGELLLGRNLDFPGLSIAHQANMVVVYEPAGGRPYAGVTWPGFLGILTGLNAAGLALSMMLVYGQSRHEHLRGQPFPLVFRRLLHECADVPPALALLEQRPWCTATNLIVADSGRRAARLQLHPKGAVVDQTTPEHPTLACTNHYLQRRLRSFAFTWFSSVLRLSRLHKHIRRGPLDVQGVKDALQATGMPGLNLQRVLMRPERLEMEVAFEDLGRGPGRWVRLPREMLFPGL